MATKVVAPPMTGYEALEKAIVGLITPPYSSNLQSKPFYAHFIQNCEREFSKDIQTLGVYVTDKVHLVINEEFFLAQAPLERIAILEHEVLHLVMTHLTRFKPRYHKIWNIACDMAINQYIPGLPKSAVTHGQFKLPGEKEAEFYYRELIKKAKKDPNGGDGDGEGEGQIPGNPDTLDDHKIWDKSNSNKDLSKAVVKGAIQQSIKNIKDYGNLPGAIQTELNRLLKEDMVNWKGELNKFINQATIVRMAMTRKRPNRRYADYEGNKNIYRLKVLVGLDTSGSIDDEILSMFFGQVERIKMMGLDIQIAECDCSLGNTYKYRKPPKKISGRGGTCFKPVFAYAKKFKPDVVIYLTDGYAEKNWKSKFPTMWVITPGGDLTGFKFGRVVEMKKKSMRF